jgi:hypothetical protein
VCGGLRCVYNVTHYNGTSQGIEYLDNIDITITYAAGAAGPNINTLATDFTTQDTTNWTWGTGASLSGGQLVEAVTTTSSPITSENLYSLIGSASVIQVVTPRPPGTTANSCGFLWRRYTTANGWVHSLSFGIPARRHRCCRPSK